MGTGQQGHVWRVYLPEFSVTYTSKEKGDAGRAECERVYAERFLGRVQEDEWRIVPASARDSARWEWRLEVRRPNQRGEFQQRPDAEALQAELGAGAVVVARYSPEDRELLEYGTRRLR